MPGLLRGLLHRAGSTWMILLVALVAAAAAALGPVYYTAAKSSILQDTVRSAPLSGRGYSASESGSLSGLLPPLEAQLAAGLGGERGVFSSKIESLSTQISDSTGARSLQLAWRSGVCAHLTIRGRCPNAPGQVLISSSLAGSTGWAPGRRIPVPGWGALTVTGVYRAPGVGADYWFGQEPDYFPYEHPASLSQAQSSTYDALFTPQATFASARLPAQGTAEVQQLLRPGRLTPAGVPALQSRVDGLVNSVSLAQQQVTVESEIPHTMSEVRSGWSSLAVPVTLITAQLLVLAWLLLFLVVTEAVEARGGEVALAKLRGYGRVRAIAFGLSEPLALLAVALPAGALLAWGAGAGLDRVLLRPGTPTPLPGLAWAAAAAATVGGLAAVALAALRTLRRPVLEEWRHARRRGADRGWVIDAVLVTAAAAGLAELAASGQFGSARRGALVLLVPGLLALAVAVIASRLLPLACRAGIKATARRGGSGWFLALRHVARRPGGVRTTMTLATAFGLAMFAVTAFAVARGNYRTVAAARVGAPTVLTVAAPPGRDLARIVDAADPGGRRASVVDVFNGVAQGGDEVVFGVDPQRFAHVALWPAGLAGHPLRSLVGALDPPEAAPLVLSGSALRVTLDVNSLAPAGVSLTAEVDVPTGAGATPVDLGTLPAHGRVTRSGALPGCPCVLRDLYLTAPPSESTATLKGAVTLAGLQVRTPAGWVPVAAGLRSSARWRTGSAALAAVTGTGLRWSFTTSGKDEAVLTYADRPDPLPAIAAAPVAGRPGPFPGVGLDGAALPMDAVAVASAVPGAPSRGVVVDRHYAELAAGGNLSQVSQQVWLAAGAERALLPKLRAAGVQVLATQRAADVAAVLGRSGPGLASVLFLADAAAAALLAAAGAVLGLYASARRRRYEYAALEASGLARRTLWGGLLAEQLVVLGFGAVVGLATGLVAALLTLRNVPEFVSPPAVPALSYAPPVGPLAALVAAGVALLCVAAVAASGALVRGVRLDQLREAAP